MWRESRQCWVPDLSPVAHMYVYIFVCQTLKCWKPIQVQLGMVPSFLLEQYLFQSETAHSTDTILFQSPWILIHPHANHNTIRRSDVVGNDKKGGRWCVRGDEAVGNSINHGTAIHNIVASISGNTSLRITAYSVFKYLTLRQIWL